MALIRINKNPSGRQLAVFALAWAVFCGVAAWWSWQREHEPVAVLFGGLGFGVPIIGWMVPALLRWTYVGLCYATYPIGFCVSHALLAVIYYGVVTPIGLAMRVVGYDPLERKRDRKGTTYWKIRRDDASPASYFRQH